MTISLQEHMRHNAAYCYDTYDRPDPTGIDARILEATQGWDIEQRAQFAVHCMFAANWELNRVVLNLSHSIAALLAATKAPKLDMARLPYDAFVVDAPSEFFPSLGIENSRVWIGVQAHKGFGVLGSCVPGRIGCWYWSSSESYWDESTFAGAEFDKLAFRLASNVVAFVAQHRECVVPRARSKRAEEKLSPTVFDVGCPRDIVVDRPFREAIKALAAAGSIAGAKRALAHIVRGHWRNQPVGEGRQERRLTWVRPHMRGDESLGRVVQRIERLR